jgi:prevent-host-death family protein
LFFLGGKPYGKPCSNKESRGGRDAGRGGEKPARPVGKKGEGLFGLKSISALIARTQFGQLLERVSQNQERFLVSQNGEAKAVILDVGDFLSLVDEPMESLRELQKDAERSGASKMTFEEIEAEIAAFRREERNYPSREKRAGEAFCFPRNFGEYERVLRRPQFGFRSQKIGVFLHDIHKAGVVVKPMKRFTAAQGSPEPRLGDVVQGKRVVTARQTA